MSRVDSHGNVLTAFKQPPRKVDKKVTSSRPSGQSCVLCGDPAQSKHHVLPRSQGGDDVAENLVWLDGSGTTGCHGDVEARRGDARKLLGQHIKANRPDTVAYVKAKLGDVAGADYLKRHYKTGKV